MKFIHISDIHLGRKQVGNSGEYSKKRYIDFFDSFEYMIDYAIDNRLDAIIIAGDLFDKKEINPDILSKTIQILTKAKDNNIPVVAIEGNHDNFQAHSIQDSWLLYLEDLALIKRPYYLFKEEEFVFYPIVIDDINFYGIGYNGSITDSVIEAFANSLDGNSEINILLTHTAIAGDTLFHGTVKSDSIALLKNKCIYVAGGHFHSFSAYPKESPFFFVPGSLEYWDNGEFSHNKGGVLFDTETFEHKHIKTKAREVIKISLTNNFENITEFYAEFYREIENCEFNNECIVNVEIKNKSVYFPDTNLLESIIYEKGVLKVFVNLVNQSNLEYTKISGKNLLIEEIEAEIISKWDYFSANLPQSIETLKLLKQYQSQNSEENKQNFIDLFDNWISSIIEDNNSEN